MFAGKSSEAVIEFINFLKKCKGREIELRLLQKPTRIDDTFISSGLELKEVNRIARELEGSNKLLGVEKTINFIHNVSGESFIETRIYSDSEAAIDVKFGTKKRIIDFHIISSAENYGFKGSVSDEIPLTKSEVETKFPGRTASNANIIRIKRRHKYRLGPWSLDITYVSDAAGMTADSIRTIKNSLFGPGKTGSESSGIEIELEHTNPESIKLSDFEYIRLTDYKSGDAFGRMTEILTNRTLAHTPENFKRLSNSVIELSKLVYSEVYKQNPELVMTDKMDGERCLLFCESDKLNIITSKSITEIPIRNHSGNIICDCEMLSSTDADTPEKKDKLKIYIFDVLLFAGKKINYESKMENRIAAIPDVVEEISESILTSDFASPVLSVKIKAKKYVNLGKTLDMNEDTKKSMFDFYNKKRKYETDGLILSELGSNYRNTKNYKWKPVDKLSIDFLLLKCPAKLLGKIPYINKSDKTLYIMLSSCSRDMARALKLHPDFDSLFRDLVKQPVAVGGGPVSYVNVPFSPSVNRFAHLFYSSKDLDGKVCELVLKDDKWKLMRIRHDKNRGNSFQIAEQIYMSYDDPLLLGDIVKPNFGYFETQETGNYKEVRNYNSYVKTSMLNEVKTMENVVDLCSGRGQDFFRYANYGAKLVLFIEYDKLAIAELISRKLQYSRMPDAKPIQIIVVQANLLDPAKTIIEKIHQTGYLIPNFDLAVCNFAFHYMSGTMKSMNNFADLVHRLLKPAGIYMMTIFSSDKIEELEKKWVVYEPDGSIKYKIKKKYDKLEVGSEIKVKLPFSESTYSEPLVNLDKLPSVFKKFDQRMSFGFSEFMSKYPKKDNLNPDDQKFVGLYQAIIYKKK